MLMMTLVSLSTFAQYPTTKKIKGQQVVIMTVKQAEAINNKFQVLEDSIAQLKADLDGCETTVNFTENKVVVASDSIEVLNQRYVTEVKRQDKLEWNDKFARKRVAMGIGAAIMTWLAFIFVTIKH